MNRVSFLKSFAIILLAFFSQKTPFCQDNPTPKKDVYSHHVQTLSDTLQLEDCLDLISQNKHLRRIQQLLDSSSMLTIKNLKVKNYPTFSLNGIYAYLSNPFHVALNSPLPELAVQQPSSPQHIYQSYVTVSQLLYDGGLIRNQNKVEEANAIVNTQYTEVEIYELKRMVTQLYFSVLLLQEHEKILASHQTVLEKKKKAIEALVAQGKLTPDNAIIIEADLIKLKQEIDNVLGDKQAFILLLSNWIKRDISYQSVVTCPVSVHELSTEVATFTGHPESTLFQLRQEELESKKKLSAADNRPKISAFGTFGYGSPALFDPFDETPGSYYWAGVALKWDFFKWGRTRRDHSIIRLQQSKLKEQENLFHQRSNGDWHRSVEQYNKLTGLLRKDKEIIERYEEVLRIVSVQLEHGLITSTAYTEKLNMLKEAQLTKNLHASQLHQEHYNILFQTGKL